MEWSGRLGNALRHAITLDPALRLSKIETQPGSAPRACAQDSRSERLSKPLYGLIRPVAVFRLGPTAQGIGWRDTAGGLFVHYVTIEKLTAFSDRAQATGSAHRLNRRRKPSTRFCPPDVGWIGSEESLGGSGGLSLRSAGQVAGERRKRSQDADGCLAETWNDRSEINLGGTRETGATGGKSKIYHSFSIYLSRFSRSSRPSRASPKRLIRCARQPAPNPLSMFITPTPAAQEFNIVSNAASPPKLAP